MSKAQDYLNLGKHLAGKEAMEDFRRHWRGMMPVFKLDAHMAGGRGRVELSCERDGRALALLEEYINLNSGDLLDAAHRWQSERVATAKRIAEVA